MKPRRVRGTPVSRAVAQNNLRLAILDQKLRIYTQDPGEKCAELMSGIAMTLMLMCFACEYDPAVSRDAVEFRIMRGGLSACEQMMRTNSWDPINARSIAEALDNAALLNKRIETKYINRALFRINQGNK